MPGVPLPAASLPGDDLIGEAGLVFDRATAFAASPTAIWPWLVQLGKGRGGWYLPVGLERMLPPGHRAAVGVVPRWQQISVGDRIPDYGGADEEFEVCVLEPPHALVHRSTRAAGTFSWALVLTPMDDGRTLLHCRFRGTLSSRGLRRRAIESLGDLFDHLTIALMFAGLRERVESP